MRISPLTILLACIFSVGSLMAAPLFTECPAAGVNTGCQFLITIGASGMVTVSMDPNSPNNGPYDGSDDTLVGVLNNWTKAVNSIPLSSTVNANGGIFGFDGDGVCTQTPHPASCPSSSGFPADPTGYGGPGVSFGNIAANHQSGVVNFTSGIAPGGTAWFGLEESLSSATQIAAGGANSVPEPAPLVYLASGIGILGLLALRRKYFSTP